ncbi:hypothetical protein HAX54_039692, partial [Datura stramonium]|nr:hypothetical protein [Datura stramonium]
MCDLVQICVSGSVCSLIWRWEERRAEICCLQSLSPISVFYLTVWKLAKKLKKYWQNIA